MKQNLFNKLWLRVGMIVAIMTTALSGTAWGADETITLSDGTFSTDHITWGGTSVTIQQLKGTSGTAVNSSYVSAPRVYMGHILSFVANSGYKINSISITYDTKYCGNSMTAGTVLSGNTVTDNTTDVSRTWDTSTSGGTHVVSAVSNEGLPAIYIQNVASAANVQLRPTAISVTYTAGGSTASYTVTYKANGGSGNDIEETYYEGNDVTVADNTFTYIGHAFTKWNTAADGSGTDYNPNDVIEDIDDDIDLYAQWEESNEFTLNFPLNTNPGGWPTTNETTITNYTYTLSGDDYTFALKNVKCNSGYLMMTATAVLGLPAIEGYKLTKVVASNSSGCSTSTKVGISSSATGESYVEGGSKQTWLTKGSQYTYNLSSTESNVMYYMYVTSANAQVINLALTYKADSSIPEPSFTISNNNEIAYNATSGSFDFAISNPVDGGTTSVSESVDWISNAAVSGNTVTFTTTANEAATSREGVITLTYAYGEETITKDVTVTQAGNPNVVDEISDIAETGVDYTVRGTVVAVNARGFVLGDGTGYVYTYLNTAPSVAVGDIKKISGSMGSYNHVYQFTNSATIEAADNSNYNNTPAVQSLDATAIATYNSNLHLSDYVQLEGTLIKSGNYYNLQVADLANDASIAYPTDAQATELDALVNKTITVKGYFAGVSGGHFNVVMESVEEVEVQHNEYALTVSSLTNVEMFVFDAADESESLLEGEGTVQIYDGTEVLVSVSAEEGYVLESLEVDGVDVTSQIDETGVYTFTMPTHAVTITATADEYIPSVEGTIVFGNAGTKITGASVTGNDSKGNTWTITTEGTTSFTPNADYSQVGSSSKPATSITFTTTLPAEATITSFEAKFGGFSGTAGDVTLKVGDTTVGTGSLNAANDVTVTNTSTATGTVLTVTVTNIAKGVKCYYISYEVEAETPTEPITVTLNASGYATFSSESAVSIPEEGDFTAWQITNVDSDNKITFEQVTGNIKAETGLFLKGTANAEVTIETAASGAELSSNILVGFPISTSVGDGEYYGLSGDTFKKVNAGNVRAGKALLPAEFVNEDIIPSTGAKAFTFVFEDDDATAISTVESFTEEGAIYNLAGQRISKMQKGINIVNGKKVLK